MIQHPGIYIVSLGLKNSVNKIVINAAGINEVLLGYKTKSPQDLDRGLGADIDETGSRSGGVWRVCERRQTEPEN